ncbi:MAG: Uma2 family endonuclease [Deltaproteobacteria bacterium]|nr:Uma2 family endonuclease [Deltaproteobacteria bacterium]
MSSTAEKLATYEDVLTAPEHRVAELVDGQLITSPRPASPHARAGSGLGAKLYTLFDDGDGGPGGWVILFEPELHLGAHVLVPDIAGWRRERMPEMPDVAYFELAPDFCCEVLSPSTARLDRVRKMPLYASHGVAHVWLVDPAMQTLEVYALDGETYRLLGTHAGEDVVEAPPFDAVPLELALLWRR